MRSPIPWMGGKRRLAKEILPMFPEHTCYVEPFSGGAALLFMRSEPAKVEVLNDIDGELVNFYRVVKHHMLEFCNQFRWAVTSRQVFEWMKVTPPDTLTDIQRAARFYYLQKLAFGAKASGRSFGTSATTRPRLNLVRLEEDMSDTHARLAHVLIERLPWEECIRRYDRPHTLFFLDPPYWRLTGYTGPRLKLADYQAMARVLGEISGRAILTINAHADMRQVFAAHRIREVGTEYTVGGRKGRGPRRELVVRNW